MLKEIYIQIYESFSAFSSVMLLSCHLLHLTITTQSLQINLLRNFIRYHCCHQSQDSSLLSHVVRCNVIYLDIIHL